jgi:ComF family protein
MSTIEIKGSTSREGSTLTAHAGPVSGPCSIRSSAPKWPAVKSVAVKIARTLEAAWLPPLCCLCGAPGQAPTLDLCDVCATFLPVVDESGRSGWEPGAHGGATVLRTLCLFKYQTPVDHFIRALKFRGERVHARVLGELMARARLQLGVELPACIVPMPLHASRLRQRGFNQAQEIARFAAESLGIPVASRVLTRKLATKEQSGLSLEARRLNVRGAFEVTGRVPAGTIALLDDVLTTGSTAMEAVEALRQGGAKVVELWAVARVEKDFQVSDRMLSAERGVSNFARRRRSRFAGR